ncbi:hypothetical protein V5799_024397 [Amblyomma americanum]|uniref:Uncharacterized protein n=1 Tax=Amblyomma americanum TaxID=6943 RepID=A0AAQ4EC72_AMBAM
MISSRVGSPYSDTAPTPGIPGAVISRTKAAADTLENARVLLPPAMAASSAPVTAMAGAAAAFATQQNGAADGVLYEPFRNGDISYVGHDCRSIPDRLVHAYAFAAYRLDLSFNLLTTIQGIEHFIQARHTNAFVLTLYCLMF